MNRGLTKSVLIAGGVGWWYLGRPIETKKEHTSAKTNQSFDAMWAPWQGPNTGYFVASEPVSANYEDCNDGLFQGRNPYRVNFGDGSSGAMVRRDTGYAIEGGGCFLFWKYHTNMSLQVHTPQRSWKKVEK